MMTTLAAAALCAAVFVPGPVQMPDISPVAHEVVRMCPAIAQPVTSLLKQSIRAKCESSH
jgi:hypothetical protein